MKKKKNGKIFIISGPSGVGKSTIIKHLLNDDSLDLHYSISMTTRNQRKDEINGKHYIFCTPNEFDEAVKNGELLEWTEFAGNKYGTPKKFLISKINAGHNILLEIEVNGAMKIMDEFKDVIPIFISPVNSKSVQERLSNRGTESMDMINTRMSIAEQEYNYREYYKYQVVNDELQKAINDIVGIIKSEI